MQPRGTQYNNKNRMIDRFKRDVRLKEYFSSKSFGDNDEIPRLCKK